MKTGCEILVLGNSTVLRRAIASCRRAGMAVHRPGRFGPGPKAALVVDITTFDRLLTHAGGTRALARELRQPLIVVGAEPLCPGVLSEVYAAGGTLVTPGELDLLPQVITRLRGGSLPPPRSGLSRRAGPREPAPAGRRRSRRQLPARQG